MLLPQHPKKGQLGVVVGEHFNLTQKKKKKQKWAH